MMNLQHISKSLLFVVVASLWMSFAAMAQSYNLESKQEYVDTILYFRYLDPEQALKFVNKGIEKATRQKDDSFLAAMLLQQGILDDNSMVLIDSRSKYLEAERIYRRLGDSVGLASTLIRLGEVERRKGMYYRAFPYLFNALEISKKIENADGIIEANLTLGKVYEAQKNYPEALDALHKAENLALKSTTNHFVFSVYIYFGQVYTALKSYDKAIEYANKGLAKVDKIRGGNGYKINLLRTLGFAYYYKGEKERGFTTLLAALELSKSAKNTMRELHILSDLAEVYESDNAPLAINYYNQALRIADRYKMPSRQAFILNELSLLYKKKGDYKTALSLKEESSKLKGEFYESSTAKRIDDLESAYDLERSKSEIAALTIAKSEQETSKTIWLVVSVLVSVVGLVVLVFSYRSHRLNTLLQQSNTQLAESNLVKDKLFSIVAHDIRSPLISLIGMLELLREKEIDSKDYDYSVLKLIENSENSLQVIDQLLKWGENQIKGVRINKITFNPVDSVNRVVQFLNNIAAKKEIRIDFVPTDIGNIEADRDHFEFVMRNLLANAIKFSHTGGIITISAHRTAENQLIFEVADKGIGIAPDRLNNLFELSSASTSGTASELGTGLGLVLCKEFVEANGGRISVWSELGKGTLFTSSFNLALDDMA